MQKSDAEKIIGKFIADKTAYFEHKIALIDDSLEQRPFGWSFVYQSEDYIGTGSFEYLLVGHGPVVIINDGRVLEGGSLDVEAEHVLRRYGIEI